MRSFKLKSYLFHFCLDKQIQVNVQCSQNGLSNLSSVSLQARSRVSDLKHLWGKHIQRAGIEKLSLYSNTTFLLRGTEKLNFRSSRIIKLRIFPPNILWKLQETVENLSFYKYLAFHGLIQEYSLVFMRWKGEFIDVELLAYTLRH
jgi:hypothetical protein